MIKPEGKIEYLKEVIEDLILRLYHLEATTDTVKYLIKIGYDREQILEMGIDEEDYKYAVKELAREEYE